LRGDPGIAGGFPGGGQEQHSCSAAAAGRRAAPPEGPYRGGRLTEGLGVVLTINMAFLLTVIVVLRLRRRTQARSRTDEQMSAVIVLVLGVLIAPTEFGHWILQTLDQLAHSISQIHI
jgi:hypothetical protein